VSLCIHAPTVRLRLLLQGPSLGTTAIAPKSFGPLSGVTSTLFQKRKMLGRAWMTLAPLPMKNFGSDAASITGGGESLKIEPFLLVFFALGVVADAGEATVGAVE
jgi:hypothetical protein